MREQNEECYPFIQLGLTGMQTKIYLEFVKSRESSVKAIAKNMQISPAEVYQVLPRLEETGLVQRILGKPIRYNALPIDQGLSILFEMHNRKFNEIRAKADDLIKKFCKNKAETCHASPKYVLWLKRSQARTVEPLIMNSQISLDVMFSWAIFRRLIHEFFEAYKIALEAGTKVRVITNRAVNEKERTEMYEIIQTLSSAGQIEIRCSSTLPAASLAIFERKIVDLITEPLSISSETCLRSDDIRIVSMMIDYFDLKWQSATAPCWNYKKSAS